MSDTAYNAGLEIRYAIAASGVDPIQHIPEVDAIIERRLADARRQAFEEAAQIAEDRAPVVQCMSVEPIVEACFDIASSLRAKAEEKRA